VPLMQNCSSRHRKRPARMNSLPPDEELEPEAADYTPSKSARKREALAAQALGEELIGLDDATLDTLALPEPLVAAIREARRISSRSAGVRQRQYIGRLMRTVDLAQVRRLIEARHQAAAGDARHFRSLETWRARLLDEPDALEALAREHPQLERAVWQRAIAAAAAERARSGGRGAQRALFRMLRELLQAARPADGT